MQITKRYRKSYFNTMAITLTFSCVYINMKHTAQPARETDSNLVISFTGRNNAIVQVYNDLRLTLDLFILTKVRLRNVGQLSIDSSISHHAIGSLDAILHGMMPNVSVWISGNIYPGWDLGWNFVLTQHSVCWRSMVASFLASKIHPGNSERKNHREWFAWLTNN